MGPSPDQMERGVSIMKCPACGKTAHFGAPKCPNCGQDLILLNALDEVRKGLVSAKETTGSLSGKLQNIEGCLEGFERQVLETLVQGKTPEPAEEILADIPPKDEETEETITPEEPQPASRPSQPSLERPMEPSTSSEEAEVRFGQKWLLIAGIGIMVLGIGYFLKYSFDKNWVNPVVRVFMTYLSGIACIAIGEGFRRKSFATFGLYLVGGGIAIFYFSTFAAYGIYDLISQFTAFLLMVVVTAVACGLSLLYEVKWLSVLGLIGGFVTPVVLGADEPQFNFLMIYMAILNAGILSIALFKRWKLLHNLGFVCTWLLFMVGMVSASPHYEFWPALFFVNLFFLMYTLVPFGYHFLSKEVAKLSEFAIVQRHLELPGNDD